MRNPLSRKERALLRLGHRSLALGRALRRLAHVVGVRDPEVGWRLVQPPTFDNQIATLRLDGRSATLRIEHTTPGDGSDSSLQTSLERTAGLSERPAQWRLMCSRTLARPRSVSSTSRGADRRTYAAPEADRRRLARPRGAVLGMR